METGEISSHQVRVWKSVRKDWVTIKDIAAMAGVARRTASMHALRLVNLGLFDQAEVFPGHRYRASELGEKRNKAYLLRLQNAAEALGIE